MLADDIQWWPAENHPYAPEGKPWIGREKLAEEFFKKIGMEWLSFGCSPVTFHDAGKTVVVEGRYFGVHRSGKKLDAQFCHVWTLSEGRVAAFHQYTDTAQLKQVMTGLTRP